MIEFDATLSVAGFHALVPAAGSGTRMGSETPKQYLPLAGRPLIWHGLRTLCAVQRIAKVFVVLSAQDTNWPLHDWSALGAKLVPLYCGGASRADSVLNGLQAAADQVRSTDWILVHDAARPCLTVDLVERLIDAVTQDLEDTASAGGILALPVADTLKRSDARDCIAATVPRAGLWQAQTPQMFRHADLRRALEAGRQRQDQQITDEASAMEMLGFQPRLVMSEPTNLKVTYPADQRLAEWILQQRGG
jgi:2-C-methyl-D-erythritol 4-phosphate cytidylyltransferase